MWDASLYVRDFSRDSEGFNETFSHIISMYAFHFQLKQLDVFVSAHTSWAHFYPLKDSKEGQPPWSQEILENSWSISKTTLAQTRMLIPVITITPEA